MRHTTQAGHSFTALADYIQELLEACRETIENTHDRIDQSKKAREKAKELLAAARRQGKFSIREC